MSDFAGLHPTLSVEVIYDEKKVDLVTSGVDAAIRAETLLDPDTYAISVGPSHEMMLVASPSYLVENASLRSPQDVASHAGICFAFGGTNNLAPWVFRTPEGPLTVMPRPRIVSNDVHSILGHAQAGLGLAYVFTSVAKPAVEKEHLIEVLPGTPATLARFSLNYLSKRNMASRLQAFIDFVRIRK